MKKIIGIVMVLLMLMSVTIILGTVRKSSDSRTLYLIRTSFSHGASGKTSSRRISHRLSIIISAPLTQNYTKVIKIGHFEENSR